MKHVVIGTAGHVDHGKTELIRALTGIDTDRLPEEKARGLTIEPGFAHLDFEDGSQSGIVDVPGHEKFIHHMLCGAAGMDFVMLVVAADEGWMPQTAEHLEILSLLGLREGLVVLTKADLVNADRLLAAEREAREQVRGTFLDGKPVTAVSARTGHGIPGLRSLLQNMVQRVQERNPLLSFRLPIDRVFTVEGFGTVVTGTLLEGRIRCRGVAELAPSGRATRVRGLQVHGRDVWEAEAGQRVAVNLAGVKKRELHRGDTLVAPGSLPASLTADVRLQLLPSSRRTIRTGTQVHLYHGASAYLARVVLLECGVLHPGESAYAQLRLAEPFAARCGDRFVIRILSPLETIGGGVILDPLPCRHKRGDPAVLSALTVLEKGDGAQRILQVLAAGGMPALAELSKALALPPDSLNSELRPLLSRGEVLEPLPHRYLSAAALEQFRIRCCGILERYHTAQPLHSGIRPAELRQKALASLDADAANAVLSMLVQLGELQRAGERYALPGFQVRLTRRQSTIRETLLALCEKSSAKAVKSEDLLRGFSLRDQADCRQVLESLLTGGELIPLTQGLLCSAAEMRRCRQTAEAWFTAHETLTLAQFRDLLGSSRDYALLVLEFWDRQGLTQREGNARRLASDSFFTWE